MTATATATPPARAPRPAAETQDAYALRPEHHFTFGTSIPLALSTPRPRWAEQHEEGPTYGAARRPSRTERAPSTQPSPFSPAGTECAASFAGS